jgi:hypothetical protein
MNFSLTLPIVHFYARRDDGRGGDVTFYLYTCISWKTNPIGKITILERDERLPVDAESMLPLSTITVERIHFR